MSLTCVACSTAIRPRQHRVCCDVCSEWTHRTCLTRPAVARGAVIARREVLISFQCGRCQPTKVVDERPKTVKAVKIVNIAPCFIPFDFSSDEEDEVSVPPPAHQSTTDSGVGVGTVPEDSPALDEYCDLDLTTLLEAMDDGSVDPVEDPTHTVDRLGQLTSEAGPVSYSVQEKGSKRGRRLLVASGGFSFTVRVANKSSTRWMCSVRSKKPRCPATVTQTGEAFRPGPHPHNHPGDSTVTQTGEAFRPGPHPHNHPGDSTVTQTGEAFRPGPHPHNHPGDSTVTQTGEAFRPGPHPGDSSLPVRIQVATMAKEMDSEQISRPASEVVTTAEPEASPASVSDLQQTTVVRAESRHRTTRRRVIRRPYCSCCQPSS